MTAPALLDGEHTPRLEVTADEGGADSLSVSTYPVHAIPSIYSLAHLTDAERVELRERLDRFIAYEPNTGCWLWYGELNDKGYGRIVIGGTRRPTHRVMWLLERGDIPVGLVTDHRACATRCCCNPAHLEIVTSTENGRRAAAVSARRAFDRLLAAATAAGLTEVAL